MRAFDSNRMCRSVVGQQLLQVEWLTISQHWLRHRRRRELVIVFVRSFHRSAGCCWPIAIQDDDDNDTTESRLFHFNVRRVDIKRPESIAFNLLRIPSVHVYYLRLPSSFELVVLMRSTPSASFCGAARLIRFSAKTSVRLVTRLIGRSRSCS